MNKSHLTSTEHPYPVMFEARTTQPQTLLCAGQFWSDLLIFVTENALVDVTADYLMLCYKVIKGNNEWDL